MSRYRSGLVVSGVLVLVVPGLLGFSGVAVANELSYPTASTSAAEAAPTTPVPEATPTLVPETAPSTDLSDLAQIQSDVVDAVPAPDCDPKNRDLKPEEDLGVLTVTECELILNLNGNKGATKSIIVPKGK